jgi:hypothetical protein
MNGIRRYNQKYQLNEKRKKTLSVYAELAAELFIKTASPHGKNRKNTSSKNLTKNGENSVHN